MNLQKTFQPSPIPKQNPLSGNVANITYESLAYGSDHIDLGHDSFAEIEIAQANTNHGAEIISQTLSNNSVADQKRTMFYSMRQIARDNSVYHEDHSKVFYHQALLMKDYEDDYTESEPFFSYYPYYQHMGYEQLRTYFTWRTQVRKGNVTNISTSYAFLYIYELLNIIGVTGPQDGMDQLMKFWQAFRVYDKVLDRYVLQWIKDYHIYYPLSEPFKKFANEHDLRIHYPTVFGYEQYNNFDVYSDISKYPIKKSIFYNEQNRQMIHDCFDFILDRFRSLFAERQMLFEDLVFCPLVKESTWIPFSRSLFFSVIKQPDRQVVLSEREIYYCQNNRWTYKTVILSDSGRQMISYIMKEMESSLRKATKFKRKLYANTNMCDSKIQNKFKAMGISFPRFIQECVFEFLSILNRKTVSVDIAMLKQIRHEALQTQEKLIVPEKEDTVNFDSVIQKTIEKKTTAEESDVSELHPLDIWTELKESLSLIELEAIKFILHEKDIKGFAVQNRVMLEVLIDGINQKAMDCLGDTLLDLDSDVIVYEEYRIKLMEMVKN